MSRSWSRATWVNTPGWKLCRSLCNNTIFSRYGDDLSIFIGMERRDIDEILLGGGDWYDVCNFPVIRES